VAKVHQLCSVGAPGGQKVLAAAAQPGLDCDAHRISISGPETPFIPEFPSRDSDSKTPAMIAPNGPGGDPITICASRAILLNLGDKTGKLRSAPGTARDHSLR